MITSKHDRKTFRSYMAYRAAGLTAREAARKAIAERPAPATEAVAELQKVYDFFNAELFGGSLPPTMLTLQRKQSSVGVCFGYYRPNGFRHTSNGKRIVDEIAINPAVLTSQPTQEILQTMVHEQCHQWQFRFGEPSRKTYHNREFAEKMKEVGLQPSATGKPGGAETGQNMSDYPIPGGRFLAACEKMADNEFMFSWGSNDPRFSILTALQNLLGGKLPQINSASGKKVKYTCPSCNIRAWGKPGLNITCGDCSKTMITAAGKVINATPGSEEKAELAQTA